MGIKLLVIVIGMLITILFLPIKLRCKINYDVFNNKGFLSLFLYKIKIIVVRWNVKKNCIIFKTDKKELKINVFDTKGKAAFSEIFMRQIIKKININNLRIMYHFGFNKDMLVISVGGALLNILTRNIVKVVSIKTKLKDYDLNLFVSEKKTIFLLVFTSVIKINLFLIILCFIKAIGIKIKKGLVKKYGN